ncbi:dihydrofolate reductase [Mucilaginibacter paludis]|uniref:Dihydrofolate reductase n=1 Tax=Mucilaginibacter paludis DSM 18603 TaxID=714943 RepID=H1YH84_9SPHI|nr:dihydrofolate reductase [Mucilaginibacter paludis]EHQ24586.1 dihydrofolate reductase region [Mucilaginibacter paludis DSM 18603]
MIITIVVAISSNYAIGKNNQLLWHLPKDLKHFKDITAGGTVIMGRKTFDSVGKPLPKRRNIVITRQAITIAGCEVVSSLDEAIALCNDEQEVFIVGGAEVYRQAMPVTNRIYLTIVHHSFDADTFFPEIDYKQWHEIAREDHQTDEKHQFAYSFITLERA